jgi:hypothetical protein
MRSGYRKDETKKRRFTIEQLVAGMMPADEHPLDDDWPVGDALI